MIPSGPAFKLRGDLEILIGTSPLPQFISLFKTREVNDDYENMYPLLQLPNTHHIPLQFSPSFPGIVNDYQSSPGVDIQQNCKMFFLYLFFT